MEFQFFAIQVVTPLLGIMLFGPVVLYLVARWRAHREPTNDPQLGLKFVLHYFSTLSFHVALAGGTLLLYTMLRPGGDDHQGKSQMYRLAFGFIVPSGIVLVLSLVALVRTNDATLLGVRKLFAGFNLLITGLAGFAALILGFQALFMKGSTGGMGHLGGAAIVVYCSAWGALGWRYYQMVLGGSGTFGSQDPPDIVTPPGPSPTHAAGGGGLPALGGGSFPPIEPRDE